MISTEQQYEIDRALRRAREVANELPSWEGGFGCAVVNAIGFLQAEVERLERTVHNLDAELQNSEDYIWCECSDEKKPSEIARPCNVCGGQVEGIVMMKSEVATDD